MKNDSGSSKTLEFRWAALGLSAVELDLYREIPAEIDFINHPSFPQPDTEEHLYGALGPTIEIPTWTHFPEIAEDLPPANVKRNVLSSADEVHLFLQYALREILSNNRAHLTDVERTIVVERFAISTRGKGRTLAEVGRWVGLTNERVRQIQNLALDKIRSTLSQEYLVA